MLAWCKVQEQVQQGETFKESWGSLVQVSVGPQKGPSAFLSSWWPQAAPLTGVIRLCQHLGHVAWIHSSKCEQDVWRHLTESEFVCAERKLLVFPCLSILLSLAEAPVSIPRSKMCFSSRGTRSESDCILYFLLVAIHCSFLKWIFEVYFLRLLSSRVLTMLVLTGCSCLWTTHCCL